MKLVATIITLASISISSLALGGSIGITFTGPSDGTSTSESSDESSEK